MKTIKLLLLSLIISSTLLAKDSYRIQKNQDVLSYHFEFLLRADTSFVQASALINIRLKQPNQSVILDLVGMEVSSVTGSKMQMEYTHEFGKINIQIPEYSGIDTLLTLQVNYEGVPKDGLIISDNKFGTRSFFGDNWPDRARNWLACVDHPSDKARCSFEITAPEDYQVIAVGGLKNTYLTENSLRVTSYESTVELPTKVMVFGASHFAHELAGYANGIPVESWVYEENKAAGFIDYKPAVEIVEYFDYRIGPFAFEKLANVQSKTIYGGMENSGAIFYYENSVSGKNRLHSLLAHEIAHQWFGDAVSEKDWHHIWLSEGFATYMEAVCMHELFQMRSLTESMARSRKRVTSYYYRNPSPVIDTTIVELKRLLSTNSYQKGGWFLHMLRDELGEQAFWAGMKSYYGKYKNKNALTSDFRHVMEEVSGKNLESFFKQWLWEAGHPKLQVAYAMDTSGEFLELEIRQVQAGNEFNFRLDLLIKGSDSKEASRQTIKVSSKEQHFLLPIKFTVKTVEIDPDIKLLFELDQEQSPDN